MPGNRTIVVGAGISGLCVAYYLRKAGAEVVHAGKGYSFDVRPRRLPRHALLLLEPHVGCSPLGDRLRIAGTMEFSGINTRVDPRRVEAIVRGAQGMLGASS